MRRFGRSKKKSQFRHACRRASLRFGIEITQNDISEIVRMIDQGDGRHLHKQSNRVSHWLIKYREIEFIAVYDKHRKMIVTFLEIEKYDWDRHEREKNENRFENGKSLVTFNQSEEIE